MNRAKIICTIGPACNDPETLDGLLSSGMKVARINFSHGGHEDFKSMITNLRTVAQKRGEPIAILGDLCGPKIRIGELEEESVELIAGQKITITTRDIKGSNVILSTTYPNLVSDVEKNNRILIDDGRIELKVIDVRPEEVHATVVIGGTIKPHKGMNLPGVNVSAPAISAKDFSDIEFAVREEIDFLALSFVRTPDDVIKAKKLISNYGSDIPVIAKIEKEEAVDAFEKILATADGIMIARGDLGVEMASEQVPLIQKRIIKACNEAGKPVITATQMLESMTTQPNPTRAETSDVANAVIDGSDAVMLSGETAVGKYPIKAAETMQRIINGVECEFGYGRSMIDHRLQSQPTIEDAVTAAACRAAELLKAKAIIAYTQSGSTARRISKHRPRTSILAISPSESARRRLSLFWGVRSALVKDVLDTESMVSTAEKIAVANGYAVSGDIIVITSGTPIGVAGSTNLMTVHKVK
ncbi:MAG: pyruvate kinase [Candidatus Latescibacteria bacterium]|nr:pyruvate kinase [Candidatus Latescibacterota bacterium]